MSRIVLVRHGEAAAGFAAHTDPGLSAKGTEQAEAMAAVVGPLGPLPILVSPLRRCRETARPVETVWGVSAVVDPAVGEVESPTSDLAERGAWLRRFMASKWDDADEPLRTWRSSVVDRVLALDVDTVVVSHFIAINAVVGAATRDARVVCFRPDYCSRTVVEVRAGELEVVDLGGQATTAVR